MATTRTSMPPATPAQLGVADWRDALRVALTRAKQDRVSLTSGSLAYHWFLSLFPLVIALLGIVALVHLPASGVHRLIRGITKALPPGASGVLTSAVAHAGKRVAGALPATVVAAAVAVWSASSGMAALVSGLNIAYEVPQGSRKFLEKRLVALGMMVVTVVLGGAAAALVVFGAPLGRLLEGYFPIGGTAFAAGWTVVRWVAALLLVALLMSALYYLGPKRESPRWQWISVGGLAGAAIWLLVSLGFSFYISSFGSYGKTYGAFAGVAVLIFWLYLTGIAVLLGAEINAGLERRRAELAERRPAGVPQSPAAASRTGAPAGRSGADPRAGSPPRPPAARTPAPRPPATTPAPAPRPPATTPAPAGAEPSVQDRWFEIGNRGSRAEPA